MGETDIITCDPLVKESKMDMSSYQFVNTLAQCYEANAQLQGGTGAVAGGGTDYYSMQYPSCYSPATQGYTGAGGYSSMMTGGTGAGSGGTTATTPHTHSEYAPASSSSTSLSGPTSSRRSPGPGVGGAASGGVTPAPLTTANVSCKYQDSNVGSPQDLSTTSSGGTPQPGGMPGGLKSPESDIEDDDPTSPMSPDPKEGASSSATSTKKEDSKSTPPQIYPWMKRVHLGQSKYLFCCYRHSAFAFAYKSALKSIKDLT